MERQDQLNGDGELASLFRSVDAPAPSSDFVARTMRAVKRAPLPAGRRRLRSARTTFAAWAGVVAGAALAAFAGAASQPLWVSALLTLLSAGLSTGVSLIQLAGTSLASSDLFITTGLAVSRVVFTKEGSAALLLIAAMGALSLSALQRLLIPQGSERGVSQWQEL